MNNLGNQGFLSQKRPFIVVLVLAVILNIAGIGIHFFTDDPALYAVIARNMAQTNNFADLIYRGHDWLDKPHFPFWMVALSFKAFGVNTIAYKLPALLFYLLSVLYMYKLANKFYGVEVALTATLILLTAQHTIMSNTDVRAEPYIMGLLMGAVYHFYKVKERFSWADILLASVFTACAVMTKGIYLLIPIGGAIIGDYLFKKQFKGLLQWRWLLACIMVALFTLPEIYTLYTQFDQHPEKVVFGTTGVSGIHWFLWDSQFGRFNNNSFIKNSHGSKFFFLHTLLWAFAPWAIVFYYALVKNIRNIFRGIVQPEYLCISAGVLMLVIFSISKFQLPFYTNILFPFFAIILAVFIKNLVGGAGVRFFNIIQYTICTLLLLIFIALNFVFAPEHWLVFMLLFTALIILTTYIYKSAVSKQQHTFLWSCVMVMCINTYFILVVYPVLLTYRSDVKAAEYMNKTYPGLPVVSTVLSNRFDFYIKERVTYISIDQLFQKEELLARPIFTDEASVASLRDNHIPYTTIKVFDDYPRENLILPFIIKQNRAESLSHFYLIKIIK